MQGVDLVVMPICNCGRHTSEDWKNISFDLHLKISVEQMSMLSHHIDHDILRFSINCKKSTNSLNRKECKQLSAEADGNKDRVLV